MGQLAPKTLCDLKLAIKREMKSIIPVVCAAVIQNLISSCNGKVVAYNVKVLSYNLEV